MADQDLDPFAKYVKPAVPAADQAAPATDADPFAKYTTPDYQAPRSAMQQVLPRAGDMGLSLAKGLIGVPETFLGLGDMVSEGAIGKLAEQAGFHAKEWKAALDKHYSPEGQSAIRNLAEAKGLVPTIIAGLQNPSAVANQAIESAPTILSGGVISRGAIKALPSLATKEGAIAAGAIGEGATAAGQNAEQVRQEDPNGTLTPGQSAILAASGALTGLIGFGAGKLANRLGIGDAATMAASGHLGPVGEAAIATGANKGILRKIGEGALVEGVGQELGQSYQEQVAQNLAQGKPWDEGAAEAGAQGMLAGGLMGAVAGPLHGHDAPHNPDGQGAGGQDAAGDQSPPPPAPPPAAPPGPLTQAASLVPGARQLFPFGSLDLAQKQADSFTSDSGIPHQAVPHPNVAGRFAAVPVTIDGADDLFVKEAERQGVDPAAAQLATHGDGGAQLMTELLAQHPDLTAQQWSDPATRAQLAAAYLKQDIDTLGEALGRAPTPAETYIGRLLGAGPAAELLNVPASERDLTPVAAFIPDPAVAAKLGVAGMPVGPAIDFFTQQADATLATLKGRGNAHLDSEAPAAGAGTVADATPAAPGAAAAGADGAAAVAPRVQVGPAADGYQNANAQRHRDTADALGLTDTIERLFGDGLTVNQVVGQIQDKAPGVVPADLPNMVNGVRATLGIPAPISPEGKGAFDAWRAEYKARGQQTKQQAAQQQDDLFPDVPDFPAGPTNVGAAKVTPEAIVPKNAFDEAAHEASTSPLNDRPPASLAQIDADNAKLGHPTLFGLPVGIENPKGSTRRSKDSDNPWESLMTAHYGRFTGTVGADGAPVDVFVGDNPDSQKVFVVDQIDPKTGKFDEHKVIAGVDSAEAARELYQDNYAAGWQGAEAVTETTPEQLKDWLKNGDTKAPFNPDNFDGRLKATAMMRGDGSTANGPNVAEWYAKPQAPASAAIDQTEQPTGTTTPAEAAADTPATPDTPAGTAIVPRAWHDSPFAPRIRNMLINLQQAGDEGMHNAIETGVEQDAKQGRLNEQNIAYREEKARIAVNTKAGEGKPPVPVAIAPETYDSLAGKINTIPALPRAIGEAAVARWNEIAPKLAALGFKDGEVDARHAPEARELQKQLKDISSALNGLAPRRYQVEREHKNINPDAIEREEDFATTVLGIDTRAHPGVDATKQITLGQGVKAPAGATTATKEQIDLPDLIAQSTAVGTNDAGEALFENERGTFRVRNDRKDQPDGYADFGGDLSPGATARLEQARTELHTHLGAAGDLFKMDGVQHTKARQDVMSTLLGQPVDKKDASVDALRAELYRRIGIVKGNALAKEMAFQQWYKDGGLVDVPQQGAHSEQYERYRKAIEAGQASEGMAEQIAVDERLNDGEDGELQDLIEARANAATGKRDNGTAPEHARNEGKPLDPNNKFRPFDNGPVNELAPVDAGLVPLDMSVDEFASITNEFAALFAAPDTYVQTEKRVDPATVRHAPEPTPAGIGKWTMTPSPATLAALKDIENAPAQPLITMVEDSDARSKKEGKRHFRITANYTNRYDAAPLTYGALMTGEQMEDNVSRDSGRVGTKQGLAGGVAEMKAMWLELESAILDQDKWIDHATEQAENSKLRQQNSEKIILSLFDYTGEWGQPWADAGYNVIPIDIQNGIDVLDLNAEYLSENMGVEGDIHGMLIAVPCTDFAVAGAKHFAAKDADGRTESSKELVKASLSLVEELRPKFWALENPVSRIESLTGLPPARMSFNPNNFGHAYTKKTMLWGNFQTDLPLSPVDPVLGSKMHQKFGGSSQETKNARSETPRGFAAAFFMANNYADLTPEQRLTGDYPEASGAIATALKAGVPEKRVRKLMEQTYENYDTEAARNALIKEVAKLNKTTTDTQDANKAEPSQGADDVNAPKDDKPGLKKMQDAKAAKEKYGASGRAALAKMAARAHLSIDPADGKDSADLVSYFEKYYNAGRTGAAMPKVDVHPDDARAAYAAGKKDGPAKAAKAPAVAAPADRATIAQRYATELMRDGVTDEVKDFHLRFADDLLAKDAFGLKWITNGLNDKSKKVFAEVTGVKLPRAQGAAWEALKAWAGVTPEQERAVQAKEDAERAEKQQQKDDDAAENDAELQRFQVSATDTTKISGKQVIDERIADGYNAIENISKTPIPRYVLVNKELGRFYPLDKIGRKYAEVALRRLGKSELAQDTDGESLVSVEQAAADQAEHERELADAKAKGQTMASDDDLAHLFGKDQPAAAVDLDALLDDELKAALSDLGDVLGDVFGGVKKMSGPQRSAGDLLPALSKVVELLIRKGLRSFQQAIGTAARAMRGNDKTAPFVDQISPRQWKAAYNAVAEFHGGTDSEATVNDFSNDSVSAMTAAAEKGDNKASSNKEADHGQDFTGDQGAQALGGMAAEENAGPEGGGGIQSGHPDGGAESAAGNRRPDDAGVSGTRGGGSGAAEVHPAQAGAKGRLGVKGTGEKGTGVSKNDAAVRGEPGELTPPAPTIPALNFRITAALRLGQGGETEKFNDNLAAIRTLKAIEADNRRATPAEQALLARYVGWGGLAASFPNPETGKFRDGWAQRGADLEALLSKKEYTLARRSVLDSHYTSETVVAGMWQAAAHLGYQGGLALESSVGAGNFLGLMPATLGARTRFIGVEYDSLTARIAGLLYPQETILHSGFQNVPLPDGQFDLAIGNPPFGDQHLRFQFKPELNRFSIHNQFFLASLDAVKPGGLQIQVVSRYLMDAQDSSARIELAKRAKLLGAIRLPDTAFKENARTSVVTDIVFLQRHTDSEEAAMEAAFAAHQAKQGKTAEAERQRQELAAQVPAWIEVARVKDPLGGDAMPTGQYFAANPKMVLGTLERSGKMQFKNDITVRPDESRPLAAQLTDAIASLPQNVMLQEPSAVDVALERYANLADALQIALAGHEAGSIRLHNDGSLQQVTERETPNGQFELTRRTLTPDSPWSEQLQMNDRGQWYKVEAVKGEDGKSLKIMNGDQPTNRNVYERHVYADESHVPSTLRLGAAKYARLRQLVALRDALVDQLNLEAEDAPEQQIEGNRKELAEAYHTFVAAHGLISEPANSSLVANMPDGALVQALESGYRKAIDAKKAAATGEPVRAASAKPAAILSERVIVKYVPPTSADSLADAIAIQTAESGNVDIVRIASLLGKSEDEAVAEIEQAEHPLLFIDPETQGWVTRNDYLTGAVKRKLAAARAAGLGKNASELESVLPEQWGAENVTALLGSTWVPTAVYQDFLQHITGSAARVSFNRATNSFTVSAGPEVHAKEEEWGSDGISAAGIISDILNSRAIKIMMRTFDNKTVVDEERTKLALLKARAINNEFGDWMFADGERRKLLVETFNEKFNTRVGRQHDGSHLILPGKVPDAVISMRRHQKNVVWRGIVERFMLIDHAVGAGKTYSAIARAMERRRMGLAKKPMIVVPNHMVRQFTADTYRLYPGAKVLAAGNKDFEKSRRRKLFAKIATGDYDIVIVPHSSFGFIGIAPDTELRYLEQELQTAEAAIIEAQQAADEDPSQQGSTRKPFGVKEAERLRDKITARMDKIRGSQNKDKLLTFEQMGVDDLTIDESHEFKNLFYSSRLTNVKGMGNKAGSQKAFDLYNKVRVLRESPKGAVTFMTGTPISNSAVEMYTMMRYLAADELRDLGLEHFDAWRAQYVSNDAAWEPNETGRLKEVNRLGRTWSNMRSLMDLYYGFTDAVSNDDIKKAYREDNEGAEFPIPRVRGGDRQSVVIQPTAAQQAMLDHIMAAFDHLPGITDPYERNKERLRLMDRARKVSLDVRAIDPHNPSKEAGGKLEKIADEVTRLYQKWHADLGTQLVFLDRSVPKSKGDDKRVKEYDTLLAAQEQALLDDDEDAQRRIGEKLEAFDPDEMDALRQALAGGWNAYQQIKDNLIARGIPANEIRFVQEANNDEQKQALFDAVNDGRVRVLIGSTQRMGAGTNVQERLVGLHHADVTWKPSDIEQREGRIIRQGNALLEKYGMDKFEVEILAYATERTIDAKMWNLNATKLRTINGIRNYDGAFSMEFEDADSVSMAELAALASGDPLLLERVKLMADIDRLELLRRQYTRKMWGVVSQIEDAERDLKTMPAAIAGYQRDVDTLDKAWADVQAAVAQRTVEVEGKAYSTYKGAMDAVRASVLAQQAGNEDAKFTIKVGAKRATSMNGAHDAVNAALGDRFEASVDGQTLVQRVALQRIAAERATELANSLTKGEQKSVILGTMLGMPLELTVGRSQYFSFYGATLALQRADGSTLAAGNSSDGKDGQFSTALLAAPLIELERTADPDYFTRGIRSAKERIADAEKALPELLPKRDVPFAHQAELDEKMARLEDVIRQLSAKPQAAAANSAPAAPELTLTGDREPGPEPAPRLQRRAEDRKRRTEDPLFARAKNGQAGAVAQHPHPISDRALDTVIERIQAAFARRVGAALPVTIKPVRGMADLPPVLQAAARRQQLNLGKGVFFENTVYVVQQAHGTAEEVERTIFHELYGHAATASLFGGEWLAKQNALLKAIGGGAGLYRLAAANQIDLHDYAAGLQADTSLTDEQRRAIMMDELLAHLAEKKTVLRQKINEFIGAVRAWLRAHGFAKLAKYGNTDLAHLLADARKSLAAKATGRAGPAMPVFARDPDHAPVFYSTLARQIDKTVTKSASPLHWAETIMGTSFGQQGVKQDEIHWSGVLDWLNLQQQAGVKKVDKAQLLDYLAENGVRVSETMQGEPEPASDAGIAQRKSVFDQYQPQIDAANQRAWDHTLSSRENDEARDTLEELMTERDRAANDAYTLPADATSPGQYGQYQLPGGENYRELLLTLPQKAISTADFVTLDANGEPFGVHATEAEARNAARTIGGTYEAGASISREAVKFQSAHWTGVGNVLAHVRFNDRTDADGAKVLFIEELQSDWGQSGKRKGFAGPPATAQELRAAADAANEADLALDAARSLHAKYAGDVRYWNEKLTQLERDPRAEQQALASAHKALNEALEQKSAQVKVAEAASDALIEATRAQNALATKGNGIAPAPFVGKTEAWLSLAVKRMIAYAAQNGYDKVAFVNGKQSVERYSLEKHVKEIRVLLRPDGRYSVFGTVDDESPQRLTERAGVDAAGLADFIGQELGQRAVADLAAKDAAKRAGVQMYRVQSADGMPLDGKKYQLQMAQQLARAYGMQVVPDGKPLSNAVLDEPVDQTYSGADLRVGGEGMKTFYDKIVPNVVNDVLKKLGGGKVGPVTIDGQFSYDRLVAAGKATGKSQAELDAMPVQQRKALIDAQLRKMYPGQLGFAISDALREKALGGLPLFSRDEQRERATPGANVERLAGLLGPQLYGDMKQMGPVTVKELFQNSFDALKGALESGQLASGEINITTDPDARTITISDNGTGMTPAIINKAFLTIAGTNKETERSSGGFGIAKMLFLFGNDNLKLVTVRDGVEATLETTGAQLMKSFNDPTLAPDIVTSKTDAPSGTTVTVKIPDSFKNPSTGTSESINFPGQYEMNRVLDTSPLFEDIVVRVNGETKDIGRNFPKDDYTTFSTVKFDWGTARIIISKQEEKNYGSNVNVLSNGLWQFGFSIKENPLDYNADNIPRKMYINVEPRLKPEDAGYPFALNRQGFSPAVSDDFGKITKYLSVIYGSNKAAENAAGFGQIEYINADGSVSDKMQLAPKIDDSARQNMLQINEGDRIEIHAGRMTVNGRAVPELTANDLAQIKIDVSKFKIDQSEIDPARPMIHDNLDVVLFGTPAQRVQVGQMEEAVAQADARREDLRKVYTDLYRQRSDVPYGDPRRDLLTENVNQASEASSNADEAYYAAADALEALHKSMQDTETVTPITQLMRERFGARFDRYLRDYGRLFMSLRDAMVAEDPDHYGRMAEVAIGTSFDKEYYGVHTMTPFRGMFMNPAISAVDDEYSAAPASNTKRIATSMVATMIHEIAHFKEMNHSQRFIGEMQRVQTLLESSDTFNLSSTRQELRSILDKNHDIYQALNDTIRHADVRNRGVELSDAGAYSARNAGRADDLRNAGQAGEDDGRVAGQAGADADPVSRSDFDAAVSRYTQDVGNLAGPLFSRSPADMSRQVGSTLKALTVTSIKNKFVDYRRLALQFLGRQQLVEVYGHLFPQGIKDNLMALYNKLAMQMDAEKNDTSAQADTIATNWGKLKDHQALAELMHDATRLQIDPRKPYDMGDIRTNYTELRARYVALSKEAKAIFTEASNAYEKHYAAVKAAVHDRIGRAMAGNPNRAAMLARMDAEFFGKIKGIYFPLARFGDYMVQVNWRGANPNPAMGQAREAIHFAETMGEAQALRAELMKQYPPEQGYQVAQVTLRAEYNAARDSVGRGFLQQMFNMFKTTGMDPSLQDAINQLYLTSLPDLSWAKHGIHRKGTPGFSQDARRAFANHMFHGARYLAKLNYADQLAQTLDDMQHYANTVGRESGYDQVKAQQVIDEMLKRHDIYMNPKNNKLSNWLTSAGYVFYLGLSPASAAVNLTQTALVAYPILGGRYGFGKAASALTAASQDAVRGHNDMGKVLKGDELRAYEEWIKSGLVDVTLAHDLTSIAAGNDSALHGAMGTTMKVFSFMFHHAERFNRQATALASYRLAREQGMDHDAAYAASVQDTYASHFDYSSGNRARVMQGDVARVVLLFKQYAQNMIYTFSRNAVRAVKGDRQAAKTIAGLLTTHALAAGVLGLPVVGMLLAAASMVGGSDDEPWDAEIALRNLFADAFGDKAGEVLAHGLSRLTPWDISARVGLNSLLLPDVQEGLAGAPLAESYLTGLLGPVAGMAVNASKGMYTIAHNNDWQRGLEEMVPAFLRGPLKTLRYAQEGIKDRTGIELVPETTLAEDAGQFLGFSPSRGREAQAGKSAIYQTDKALQQRRQQLMNQYAHHVMQQEDPASTLQAIQAFNALHPSRMIAPLHLQHSVRLRMQHVAQAKEGIFLPKSRRDARAAGAFADETP